MHTDEICTTESRHKGLSQPQLDTLSQFMRAQKWDELSHEVRLLKEECGDQPYLLYCEGKCFRNKKMFPDAIAAYQKAMVELKESEFYFHIKKDLAIAYQQNGDPGLAVSELTEVVRFWTDIVDEKNGEVDATDPTFLDVRKNLASAINSLGLTYRMHGSEVYQSSIFQSEDGERYYVEDQVPFGDRLMISAIKCYRRALELEHENFEVRFPGYFYKILEENNIQERADDHDFRFNVSLDYLSADLEYCLYLTNYLNLILQFINTDLEGFEIDTLFCEELYGLGRLIMPKGHHYYKKWLSIEELAKEVGFQFDG